mgnify:CR=1 FL=1
MAMGKRQLVLAALVVALGAAVYLNWALSGNTQLPATDAVASGRELGETLLVNASGAESANSAGGSSAAKGASSTAGENYFTNARLSRQKSRDEAVETLKKVVSGSEGNESTKQTAVSQANTIAQDIVRETEIESLIKAKGFEDCVVFLQGGECSVVVKTKASVSQDDAIIVRDIVASQAGISYDKINIVERE